MGLWGSFYKFIIILHILCDIDGYNGKLAQFLGCSISKEIMWMNTT